MIAGMPSDPSCGRGKTSRRALLRAAAWVGGAAGTALLSSCGIRIGNPNPPLRTPLPRQPLPDEQILLTAFDDATHLARDAAALTPADDLTRRLAALHRTHSLVLRDALRRAGVPDAVVSAASPAPGESATTGTSSRGTSSTGTFPIVTSSPSGTPLTRARLAAAEATALTAAGLDLLSGATTPHRPTLTAIAACRAAAVTRLGGAISWLASDPLPATDAVTLLDATRAVAYGFEIVAAHLHADARQTALATLRQVQQRETALVSAAGAAAPPEPLGYDLPFPVSDPDGARRLATTVLSGLVARGLDPLDTLPIGSAAIGTVVRLQAEAVMLGTPWGVAATPFPGMAYP